MSSEIPLLQVPGVGWAMGCSRTGSAHRRKNKTCQDAFLLWAGAVAAHPYLAIALADGHGAPNHDRSQIGADLAVRAAAEELHQLVSGFITDRDALRAAFKHDFPHNLSNRWRHAVGAHAVDHYDDSPIPLLSRYGSTLLAALILPDSILLARLGDGEIWFSRPDQPIEFPTDRGQDSIGKETHSLANADASSRMRTGLIEREEGGILMLATDGIDSLADGGMEELAVETWRLLNERGLGVLAGSLPTWLDDFSSGGCGDDITLAVIGLPESQPTLESEDTSSSEVEDESQVGLPESQPTLESEDTSSSEVEDESQDRATNQGEEDTENLDSESETG